MKRLIPDEDSGYNAGQDLLERAAARGGARVLRCETRDCSGSELVARVIGFQRGLDASGLSAGDRVLVVLRDTLDKAPPPTGSYGMLVAMGPGFCCELVLLRW